MNNWQLYETRLSVLGADARDRSLQREREAIMRKYMSSPALKEVEINGLKRFLIINSTDTTSEKTFSTLPGETINLGDILFWNNMHWLVTQVDFDDELTRHGRIVQCNRQIRWQNRQTGKIVERWCLATKPYTSNIAEGIVVANSNREYKIQLSYDEETILVDLDRRFLLEVINGKPKAYQVTSVDTLTNRYQDIDGGFLIWNLKQCEYNPAKDNAELMIANYFEPGTEPPTDDERLKCIIDGRDKIRVGMKRTYTATFLDEAGTAAVNGVPAVWSVVAPEGTVEITGDGYFATVLVREDLPAGTRIQIILTDADGRYQPASFYVEVEELL